MQILRRFILLLIPILWIIGFELLKRDLNYWLPIAIFLSVQLIITIAFICKFKFNGNFWHFLILPIFFELASWLLIIFMTSAIVYYVVVIFTAFALYSLLRQYYQYFHLPFRYQPYSLESLSLYLSLLSVFFVVTASFGGLILIQLSVGYIVLVLLPLIILVTYQFFWMHKIDLAKNWLFVLIITLILAELFVSVAYLPTSYYVNSFVLTVAYYLMLGMSKSYLSHHDDRNTTIGYIVIGVVTLLIVLFTAQWS